MINHAPYQSENQGIFLSTAKGRNSELMAPASKDPRHTEWLTTLWSSSPRKRGGNRERAGRKKREPYFQTKKMADEAFFVNFI